MVYIGTDHRGFNLKEKIKIWLSEWGYDFEDLGAAEFEQKDDYTVYASKVASSIQKDPYSFGILLCGSGVGVDIAANKFDNVRASIGKSVNQVRAGRRDDDMNVLVIAADYTKDGEAKDMIKVFLSAKFDKEERHARRLADIKKIEESN